MVVAKQGFKLRAFKRYQTSVGFFCCCCLTRRTRSCCLRYSENYSSSCYVLFFLCIFGFKKLSRGSSFSGEFECSGKSNSWRRNLCFLFVKMCYCTPIFIIKVTCSIGTSVKQIWVYFIVFLFDCVNYRGSQRTSIGWWLLQLVFIIYIFTLTVKRNLRN